MSKNRSLFWEKCKEVVPWAIVALTVLGSHFAADAFLETFELWSHGKIGSVSYLRIGYIGFFAVMVYLLIRQKDFLFRPRTRYLSNEEAAEREHLVLFLSNLPPGLEASKGIPDRLSLSQDINKDLQTIKDLKQDNEPLRWTWEMPLRALHHHVNTLRTLTLICSKESISQVNFFVEICKQYRIKNLEKIFLLARKDGRPVLVDLFSINNLSALQGFDFQSFDELSQAIWYFIQAFKKKRYPEHQIMIDITGGQKPSSIVGASMTFNRAIKAQYVSTNEPWNVLSYDIMLTSSETREFGL